MGRRGLRVKRAPVRIPALAREASWLASDRYDRKVWAELTNSGRAVRDLIETGSRLVPHFDALLCDLFVGLFKLNLVWMKPDAVRQSARLNRAILETLLPSPGFQALRLRTELEEDKAAIGALALADSVLEKIRQERLVGRSEMLDLWDLARQEEELSERAEVLKSTLEGITEGEPAEGEAAKSPEGQRTREFAEAAERAVQISEAKLQQKVRRFEEQLTHSDQSALVRLQLETHRLVEQIEQAAQDAHDFGREFGQGGRLSAAERLELGRRLARNKKIGELARMVGRLKLEARALRRRVLDRGISEAYDIEQGADLGRLIPSELLALDHPVLMRDFSRRLLEGALLQYQLRADEQKGRGPMVVCIDVSSSMEGEKELWSKAVGLTLMDLARRGRRLFRAVLFSSGERALKVLDLNRERRYEPDLGKVLELAEYFPGGGTEFERPLEAALTLLGEKRLKRGDVVIITDGQADVTPAWRERFRRLKEELQFSLFAVLVDVGASSVATLADLADRITTVKRLTVESSRDLFLHVSR